MAQWKDDYSGRPQYELILDVTVQSQNVSAKTSTLRFRMWARSKSGWGSWAVGSFPWIINYGSSTITGSRNLDFRPDSAGKTLLLVDTTRVVSHASNGTLTLSVRGRHTTTSVFGSADTTANSFTAPSLASPPGAPRNLRLLDRAARSLEMAWDAPSSNGGSAITGYVIRRSLASNMASPTTVSTGATPRTRILTGLVPSTRYYIRVAARNAAGEGPQSGTYNTVTSPAVPGNLRGGRRYLTSTTLLWDRGGNGPALTGFEVQVDDNAAFSSPRMFTVGDVVQFEVAGLQPASTYFARIRAVNPSGRSAWGPVATIFTAPSEGPEVAVAPTEDGRSATITLTPPPPGSVSGYLVQRRVHGSTTTTDWSVAGATLTVSGMLPGMLYEWRAAATIPGGGTSPYSDWVAVLQPAPVINPGDYFDGSSDPRADVTYKWLSAPNNSPSIAEGRRPEGWSFFDEGNSDSGGEGSIARVTGGRSGHFAARVTFSRDATSPGFHAGLHAGTPGAIPAEAGNEYSSLIHVQMLDRTQRMAGMILWLDENFDAIGRSVGAAEVVASDGTWVPLRARGVAPGGTHWFVVRAIDEDGLGWSAWRSGDRLLIDDIIAPFSDYYFDGDTPAAGGYEYLWEGGENQSVSFRQGVAISEDLLIDPDCPPVPPAPRPPGIEDSCMDEEVTEWRRTWTQVDPIYIPSWGDSVPIVRVRAEEAVRLVRIRYFQNPFGRPLLQLDPDAFCGEQVISFIPARTTLTMDGISQRAWAEPDGSAQTLAADHLVLAEGEAPLWPVLGCGIAYYITVDVPLDTPRGLIDVEYSIVQRY